MDFHLLDKSIERIKLCGENHWKEKVEEKWEIIGSYKAIVQYDGEDAQQGVEISRNTKLYVELV